MQPTMDAILRTLVSSTVSPSTSAGATAVASPNPQDGEEGGEEGEEEEEDMDIMKVLTGLDQEVEEEEENDDDPGNDAGKKERESSEGTALENEERFRRLKVRQTDLEKRFTSLSKRIQALRFRKLGAHVASELSILRESSERLRNDSALVEESEKSLAGMEGHMKVLLTSGLDSDATESSSGGESCDEYDNYPEDNEEYLPVTKRARWTWLRNRASIAAKWTWLTAQISDLEFKIRQQSELYRQIRASKGPVLLEPPPKPTSDPSNREIRTLNTCGRKVIIKEPVCPEGPEESRGSCRTRAVKPVQRRRILSTKNLYNSSSRAAKECSVRCDCLLPDQWCSICYGRKNRVQTPVSEGQETAQSIALLDHSYHHVISSKSQDVSLDLHIMTKIKNRSWLSIKDSYSSGPSRDSATASSSRTDRMKKPNKKKKKFPEDVDASDSTIDSLSRGTKKKKKKKNDKNRRRSLTIGFDGSIHDFGSEDLIYDADSSPLASPSISGDPNNKTWLEHVKRKRESAYDIDNIVIPYSIAAATRVERLQYKEIITPTWRIVPEEEQLESRDLLPKCKSDKEDISASDDEEEEDISQSVFELRHQKAELEEQRRWKTLPWKQTGGQRGRSRRQDSRTDMGSGCNTPDPLSPGLVDTLEVSTRPSTPVSIVDETPQSIRNRRRTSSTTKSKDRSEEPASTQSPRCMTPNSVDQTITSDLTSYKAPFESRNFPISQSEFDALTAEMPVPSNFSQPSVAPESTNPTKNLPTSEVKKPSQSESVTSVEMRLNNNNSSCESSTDDDDEDAMEDDPDWNGDDPDDPEWESQPKKEN